MHYSTRSPSMHSTSMRSASLLGLLLMAAAAHGALVGPPVHGLWSAQEQTLFKGKHEDLPGLVQAMKSEDGWITTMTFTISMRDMVLNAIWSLVVLGGVRSVIVNALGVESLRECISLNLPCFDARRIR
jgi:hypothetical protein